MTKATFKVVIAGSRDFCDYDLLKTKCDAYLLSKHQDPDVVIEIVSGTAYGADQLGERYASERGYKSIRFPADWKTHGKKAGYLRNVQMAEYADALIAFNLGTKGTNHMINIAKNKSLLVRVVNVHHQQ